MKKNKRFMKTARKILAVTIAVAVVITSVEVSAKVEEKEAIVSETGKQVEVDREGKVLPVVEKELKKERTENSNTYLLNNGMKQTVYYSENIRYEDKDGKLKDYNPELINVDKADRKNIAETKDISKRDSKEYIYTNAAGDTKQYMPEKISEDTPVLLINDDYSVSFAPISSENKHISDSAFSENTENVKVEKEKIEDALENEKNAKVKAVYEDKENNVELSYQSQEHGIKEDIILNEKPKSNIFAFQLTVENMSARLDAVGGGITFIDEDRDKIIGGIAAPFMNDASNNAYSEDVHFELENVKSENDNVNKYILKVVADESYLADSARKYPVTIDPSVTWNGTSDLPDVYILKASPGTNYFSSGVNTFSVGKGSQGLFRSYFRAMELKNTVKGKYVESAKLTMYENGSSTKGTVIEARLVNKKFKCGEITWNTRAGYTSKIFDTITSSGSVDAKKTLDLTAWARGVANGSYENYGILLKAKNESVSSYVKFYGARTSVTAKRPKLAVTYYDGPTTASSVNVTKSYLKSGENLQVSWAGINSKALDYVQYRVANFDESKNASTDNYVEYASSTKIGTTASGTKTISGSSSWKEGHYKIFVRGVDKGGIKGTAAGAHFVVDRTAPVLTKWSLSPAPSETNYNKKLPTLTWGITEKYLSSIQVSINGGKYTSIGTTNSGSKQITGLVSGKVNTINIRAADRAGNYSAVKTYKYAYDNTVPVISSLTVTPSTDSMSYAKNTVPEIKYSVSDSTLKSVDYKIGSSSWISLNNNAAATITPDESLIVNGANTITLRATDKAGNITTKSVTYYRDNENPAIGKVTVTPKTGKFTARKVLPIVKWSGFEDSFLKEVQISINGSEYKKIGEQIFGEAQLEASDISESGAYELKIRAVDKAGNTSDEVAKTYYYKDTVSEVDPYTPTDVYTVERIGGSTVLRFSNVSGQFPGDIEYEVHRGTTPLFVPGDNTLVKTGGRNGIIEVSADMGTTYYYKLRAVTADGEKKYSAFSDEISSTTLSDSAINSRCGSKDMYEYLNVSTPNGTGNIELSSGNFMYEQSDIELPASQIPINISRVYNSKSQTTSAFGYGWSSIYDMYVSTAKNGKVYFQDGTKAVYVFEKNGEHYICVDDSEMELTVSDETIERTITETNEDNSEKKTEIEFDNSYIITTKENEKFYFDDCGRLNLVEEANGTFVYIEYNQDSGNIEFIVTNRGQKAEYTYTKQVESGDEYVSKIAIADGSYYSYEYENDRLTKAVHHGTKGGKIEYKYVYDHNGALNIITDAMGNDYAVEYSGGQGSKFLYPNGEYYGLAYDNNTTTLSEYTSNRNKLYDEIYKFDSVGKISEKKDAMGNVSTYAYDNKNNKNLLTSTVDKNKYYKLENGIVVEATSTLSENIQYDDNNNIISQIDKDGNVTTYTYDNKEENLKNFPTTMKVTDALGNVNYDEVYEYDRLGNVTKTIDYTTNTVTIYTYDKNGNVTKSVETLVQDDDVGNAEEENIASGLMVTDDTSEYDSDGNTTKEKSEAGTIDENIISTYDAVGKVETEIDGKGVKTEYKYDEFGRVIETKETSKGKTTTITSEYNNNGTLVKEKDKVGRISTFEYDEMNRVVKQTIKAGEETKVTTTSYGYESVSINEGKNTPKEVKSATVVTTKNTNGEITGKTYTDNYGRTVRELSNGLYVDYSYDNQGRVLTTYTGGTNENNALNVAEGKLSVSTYDENGNQTDTIINPEYNGINFVVGENSIVTSNVYDKTGILVKTVDAKGNVTRYDYDEQGRLTKVSLNDGTGTVNETSYNYDIENKDENGNLISMSETVKDALGRISETVFNGAGQTLSIIDRSTGTNLVTSYEYDTSGNKVKEIYSDGSYVTYEYNEFNYVIKIVTHSKDNQVRKTTVYEYDEEYNVVKTIDSKNGIAYRYTIYQYDELGRNTGVAEINASSEPTQPQINSAMLLYVYDIDDNITQIYYPKSENDKLKGISFKYNKDKWITEIDGILSGNTSTKIRAYEYYSDGKIKNIKDFSDYLNGDSKYIQRDYEYDVHDRVISMKYFNSKKVDKILEQYNYTYDKNSNILSEHTKLSYDNNLKDEERSYKYDNLNRLIKTKIVNNLTYETSEITYTFDKVGNRIGMTEDGVTTTYTYNDLDQMVKSVEKDGNKSYTTAYEYDKKGNQIKVIDEKKNTVTENTYDVESQLVGVNITKDGKVISTQTNEYNGDGQRISKTDNGVKTCYYYEGSLLLYTTDADGNKTSQNIIGNQDNVISSIRYEDGQHAYFYSKDVQGSTSVITDEEGNCVTSYDYTDYGETTKKVNAEFYNEICYTGGVYDELTGLYYLNARYYNPEDGVFLSQDTYRGEEDEYDTWNLYAYCAGNPVNYVDPSGHSWAAAAKWVLKGGKVVVKKAVPFVKKAGKAIIKKGKSLGEKIIKKGKSIAKAAGNAIKKGAKKVGKAIKSGVSKVGKAIKNGIKKARKIKYGKSFELSKQKMYKQGYHFNKHGREMGYSSKKEYEKGARRFWKKNRFSAEIFEGKWNSSSGEQKGQIQVIIRSKGKQLIVNKETKQIVDFYEGTSIKGFLDIKKVQ